MATVRKDRKYQRGESVAVRTDNTMSQKIKRAIKKKMSRKHYTEN
jgi:hypothetical protein